MKNLLVMSPRLDRVPLQESLFRYERNALMFLSLKLIQCSIDYPYTLSGTHENSVK